MDAATLSLIHRCVSELYLAPARLAGEPTIDMRLGHVQARLQRPLPLGTICHALESPLLARRCVSGVR